MTRCAVYTRKSHHDGLEKVFNSLEAQRFSAENYIKSQQHEGWKMLPKNYDDGGFSGGNLERPALQELLNDIAAGFIDCVVVYKIDRLSRSLLDFAKILDFFELHHVTFIAVTQSFNTSDAIGRLTLNQFLSFAQFEREIASERIRDKFAASRQKGMWMGGRPPLGYDVGKRELLVNAEEARLIQHIFTRFLVLASATHLAKELNNECYRAKEFTAKSGNNIGGGRFTKALLRYILTNPVYIGKVRHKGKEFDGLHESIIDQDLWDRVQDTFKTAPKRNSAFCKSAALLKGIIYCQGCNVSMTPAYTAKKDRHYRYYVCSNVLRGNDECRGINTYLAAGEVEHFVTKQVLHVLKSPEVAAQASLLLENTGFNKAQAFELLKDIEAVWKNLFPIEQQKIIQTLIRAVYVSTEGIDVRINQCGLQSLIIETQDEVTV